MTVLELNTLVKALEETLGRLGRCADGDGLRTRRCRRWWRGRC